MAIAQPHRRSRAATAHALAGSLALAALLLATGGCEDINWPFHRAQPAPPAALTGDAGADSAAACADLRSQIRDSQEMRREAPATSINPDIVDAAEGKADKRIEDLQQQYQAMDCPEQAPERPVRQAPLQPAPGAINR